MMKIFKNLFKNCVIKNLPLVVSSRAFGGGQKVQAVWEDTVGRRPARMRRDRWLATGGGEPGSAPVGRNRQPCP